MTSTLRTNAALTARNKPLTGDTKTSFVIDDHMGWLKCDGRLLDRTTYNLLFQVIGTTFGTTSATNFKLPDPQGRVMGSVGPVVDVNGRTRTYAPGDSVGELDHQLTIPEMPSHNHNNNTPAQPTTSAGYTSNSMTGITHNANGGSGGFGLVKADGFGTPGSIDNSGGELNTAAAPIALTLTDPGHSHTIASNGGDQYHNNVQPTLFYGNTFIYCGIPISTNGVSAGMFPYTVARNPVLI
uniref:Phage tail collar domain-containing protein n=1 Tax=viral metagenome TaxID=1070528 RepID=A0A6C0DFY0_9ZZZZ